MSAARFIGPRRTAVGLAGCILLSLLALIPAAAASSPGTVAAAETRFDHGLNLAWDTTLCSDAPVTYVADVLLGVDLSPVDAAQITSALAPHLDSITPLPYGVTAFKLQPGVDALATRNQLGPLPAPLHLNHVFFYSPFWRFSPKTAPAQIAGDDGPDPIGVANRPVVVIDTGYPINAPEPMDYFLGTATRTGVDTTSVTANHGPFIASRIARLAPGEITLQRVLSEQGLLHTEAGLGDEEIFDEVALLLTLKEADLDNALDNAVVNLSFGTYGCEWFDEPAALYGALQKIHKKDGALFVAAAGNDESDAQHYPAAYAGGTNPMVVSVGAHNGNESSPRRACFSNFGTVSIWAPGVDVLGFLPTPDGQQLAIGSGTSFAAPMVTAALATGGDLPDLLPDEAKFFTIVDDHLGGASRFASACS